MILSISHTSFREKKGVFKINDAINKINLN